MQDKVAGGAEYVSPEAIPWAALRAILGESVYGGKIDNTFDGSLLSYVPVAVCAFAQWSRVSEAIAAAFEGRELDAVAPVVPVGLSVALLLCRTMLEQVFVPESFKADFALIRIPGSAGAAATEVRAPEPSVLTHDALLAWVDSLPSSPPPTWLGLASTADNRLLMLKVRCCARSLTIGYPRATRPSPLLL